MEHIYYLVELQVSTRYLEQFIDGLRFLTKLDKAYRKMQPDFSVIAENIHSNQTGELREVYDSMREGLLKCAAEDYLNKQGSLSMLANSCHGLSHAFHLIWGSLTKNNFEVGSTFPLSVTIGNVFYKNENIYNLSKSSLKRILNEGKHTEKSLDVHVWLTWDDMTVLDLSIISTLIRREKLDRPDDGSLALIWTEDDPGDYWFEPILVDNDFFNKVDSGHLEYLDR